MIYVLRQLIARRLAEWRRSDPPSPLVTAAPSPGVCPRVRIALPVSRAGRPHSLATLVEALSLFVTRRATNRLRRLHYARLRFSGSPPRERWCAVAEFTLLNDHGLSLALAECHALVGETLVWEIR